MLRLLLRRKSWTTESAFAARRPANCNDAFNRGCLLKRQSRNSSRSHIPQTMTSQEYFARTIRTAFTALVYPMPRSPPPPPKNFVRYRKEAVEGKRWSGRLDLGGGGSIKKKKK